MIDLRTAINILEMIIATLVVLTLGNYLGHKIGRWRLAAIASIVALAAVIIFAIYAAVVLQTERG